MNIIQPASKVENPQPDKKPPKVSKKNTFEVVKLSPEEFQDMLSPYMDQIYKHISQEILKTNTTLKQELAYHIGLINLCGNQS